MGGMALGGIGMSLLAPRSRVWNCPDLPPAERVHRLRLRGFLSLLPLNTFTAAGVALVIGLSLGLLTVTLVANLDGVDWLASAAAEDRHLGTGIGYFVCNFPPLFNARPGVIAQLRGAGLRGGVPRCQPQTAWSASSSHRLNRGRAGKSHSRSFLLGLPRWCGWIRPHFSLFRIRRR